MKLPKGYNKQLRYEALAELAGVEANKTIIDCACGKGLEGKVIIETYHPTKYIGIDLDKRRLSKAKSSNPNYADCYLRGDIRVSSKEQFDYYFCVETLEHLPEEDNPIVAKAVYSAIKPGGKLLISVPENPKYAMESEIHLQIFNKEKLVEMFDQLVLEKDQKYIKCFTDPKRYSWLYVFKKGGLYNERVSSGAR